MKAILLLLAPLFFSVLSLLAWALFLRKARRRTFPRFVLWCTVVSASIYIAGFAASLFGDWIHGPADSWHVCPIYGVALPLMIGGWWASLINLIEATVGTILLHAREKRVIAEPPPRD